MTFAEEKTCLIVPNYGAAFEGMLLACLESAAQAVPGMRVYVAWQDMALDRVAALAKAYPDTRWIKSDISISGDYVVRISAKTLLAGLAAKKAVADGCERLVLMDSDIMVREGFSEAFEGDFDVAYTDKPERWPLNSGVIFMKAGKALEFLGRWSEESAKIGTSPELLKEASSKELPYGGIDQMALYQMTAYERGRSEIAEKDGISYKGLPCAIYNETRSLPVDCPAKLVHFKGGWHKILTRGAWYSPKRPMKDSLEMHQFYLRTALAGLKRVNEAAGRNWTLSEWNLAVPAYLDQTTLQPVPSQVIRERMLTPFRRVAAGVKFVARRVMKKC
jgi:hypothetical protein